MYNWIKLILISAGCIYMLFFAIPRWESTFKESRNPEFEKQILTLKQEIILLEIKVNELKKISDTQDDAQSSINKNYQNKIKKYKDATPDRKVDIFNNMYNSIDFKRPE